MKSNEHDPDKEKEHEREYKERYQSRKREEAERERLTRRMIEEAARQLKAPNENHQKGTPSRTPAAAAVLRR